MGKKELMNNYIIKLTEEAIDKDIYLSIKYLDKIYQRSIDSGDDILYDVIKKLLSIECSYNYKLLIYLYTLKIKKNHSIDPGIKINALTNTLIIDNIRLKEYPPICTNKSKEFIDQSRPDELFLDYNILLSKMHFSIKDMNKFKNNI